MALRHRRAAGRAAVADRRGRTLARGGLGLLGRRQPADAGGARRLRARARAHREAPADRETIRIQHPARDGPVPACHRRGSMKNQTNLKLDIFPHIFPRAFFERMKQIAENNPALGAQLKRWLHIPVLWDLERRIKMMKRFAGYKQILTLSLPAIEFLGNENETPELARLANDGMAQIVADHPDLFPAFVASLPMNNVPAALEEIDRAVAKLGAKGIQIFTNVNGRPLDD